MRCVKERELSELSVCVCVSPPPYPYPSHSATGCEEAIGEEREERGEKGGGALVLRRRACELYVSAKFTPCIIKFTPCIITYDL